MELCSPGFTAYLPGSPPMDLKGFDAFEAMIHSGFSDSAHASEELVGVGDDIAVRSGRSAAMLLSICWTGSDRCAVHTGRCCCRFASGPRPKRCTKAAPCRSRLLVGEVASRA